MKAQVRNYFHTGLKSTIVSAARKKKGIQTMLEGVVYSLNNYDVERPSQKTLDRYNNIEIGGYAEDLSPSDIENDLRFSIVADYLKGKTGKVLDIGCASGDLLAYIQNDKLKCEGIDFNVDIAKKKFPNIAFREGYFRDMDWQCDYIVFVSTATCFTPKELEATIQLCKERGVKEIIFSEPYWWNQKLSKDSKTTKSTHGKYICWNHDYCGYLNQNGYKTTTLNRINEKENSDRVFIVGSIN